MFETLQRLGMLPCHSYITMHVGTVVLNCQKFQVPSLEMSLSLSLSLSLYAYVGSEVSRLVWLVRSGFDQMSQRSQVSGIAPLDVL